MQKNNAVFWTEQIGESLAAIAGLMGIGAAFAVTTRYVFAELIPDHIEQFRIGMGSGDPKSSA
ncbi:hypothetical protein [Nocardia heshunensis]